MATDAPPFPPSAGPGAHDHAMRWLARHLRAQRLTVLVVPDGLDIHSLLQHRLMLLLGRRESDVDLLTGVWDAVPRAVPERRLQRQSETTAFFDGWAPMARSGALDWRPPGRDDRVLLVMPQLGAALRDACTDPAAARWLQALVQGFWALDGRDQRPVQVLLAIDAASQPLLEILRLQGLPVDDLLVHWQPDGQLVAKLPTPPAAAPRPVPGAKAPSPAVGAAPAAAGAAPRPAPVPQQLQPQLQPQLQRQPQRQAQPLRSPVWALGMLGLVGTGLLAWALLAGAGAGRTDPTRPGAGTRLAALDAPPPAPAAPASASAHTAGAWPLMVAASPGGLPQPVADLAGRVGPAAGVWLAPQSTGDWAEGLHRLRHGPGLLVVRYDALRAARQADPALAPRLLTPLYTEPLLAIVRSSSPLTALHQLRGQRVRVAGAGSADALSASGLLQAMFGAAAPALLHAAQGALPLLPQADDEVLLTVGRPGRPWTDALPPGLAHQYRLLPLVATDPAGRRALQQHLPLAVDGPGGRQPTLGVVSFLVASPGSGDEAALLRLAQALCRTLPALQQTGDPAWRGWQPGQVLTSGWPLVDGAAQAWRACASAPPAAAGDTLLADAGTDRPDRSSTRDPKGPR